MLVYDKLTYAGTLISLEAAEFIHVLQKRQSSQVASLEEIAFLKGFIDIEQPRVRGERFASTS